MLPSIAQRARCLLSPFEETGPDRWRSRVRPHRRPDGWKSIDIFLPADKSTMLITQRITSLGDIVIRQVQAQEIRAEHFGGCEDLLTHVVPIGQTACLFDEQAHNT